MTKKAFIPFFVDEFFLSHDSCERATNRYNNFFLVFIEITLFPYDKVSYIIISYMEFFYNIFLSYLDSGIFERISNWFFIEYFYYGIKHFSRLSRVIFQVIVSVEYIIFFKKKYIIGLYDTFKSVYELKYGFIIYLFKLENSISYIISGSNLFVYFEHSFVSEIYDVFQKLESFYRFLR